MEEKRQHRREPVKIAATCQAIGSDTAWHGRVTDISMGGMFVEASEVPPFGTLLNITARLPGQSTDVVFPGTVRWVKSGGFGVQFGLLGARETHALTEFLRKPS